MVQREVADRIACGPGGSDYSGASVKVQARADVRRVASVSRNSFYPRPGVDSAILQLSRRDPGDPDGVVRSGFFDRVVTAAFSQRRKKLVNSLAASGGLGVDAARCQEPARRPRDRPGARAEDLSPEQFIWLSERLEKHAEG